MLKNLIKITATAVIAFAISACGNANSSNVTFVDSTGKHPADWVKTHKNFSASLTSCTECHGSDLSGGISRTTCVNPAARCHASSPAVYPSNCLSCHVQGTAPGVPANSYLSGNISFNGGISQVNLHELHIRLSNTAPVCAVCHNSSKVEIVHFENPAATAASTIGGGNTRISAYTPYSSSRTPSGSCTTSCHVTRFWKN